MFCTLNNCGGAICYSITPLGFDSVNCNGFSDGTAFVGGVTGVTGGNGSVYGILGQMRWV